MSSNKPIFGPLDPPPSSWALLDDFLANVWSNSQAANSQPATPAPSEVYTDLTARHTPGRGLLYSFLLHEIAIFVMLFPPGILQTSVRPRRVVSETAWMLPSQHLYLPPLGGGRSGAGSEGKAGSTPKPGSGAPKRTTTAPALPVPAKVGFAYPGPQRIVSNPPRPDNRIQTILQPELIRPPKLQVPLALPNLTMIARAPEPLPPPPVPVKIAPKPLPLPKAPPPKPEVPDAPRVQSRVQAQNLLSAIPISRPLPPKVAVKLALPPPAPASEPKHKEQSQQTPAAVPEPPRLTAMARTGELNAASLLVLSPVPAPPSDEPPQIPPGEARGQFAISPEATLGAYGEAGAGAGGENTNPGAGTTLALADIGAAGGGGSAAGEGSAAGSGSGAGSSAGDGGGTGPGAGGEIGSSSGTAGTGTGGGGLEVGAGLGRGSGSGIGSGTSNRTGEGAGSGAGTGPGEGPFAGITIADGRPGPAVATPPLLDSRPAPKTQDNSRYGLTVVATGTSGGGLKDYGIFRNESVYTVYVEMNHSDTPAPAWILQYALLRKAAANPPSNNFGTTTLRSVQMEAPVQAPFPVEKEYPQFPAEIVSRNLGRMIVVYAVINAEGQMEQMRIVQSPNPLLNQPLLEALGKWSFQPAAMTGEPVAVKSLLGIVLSGTP